METARYLFELFLVIRFTRGRCTPR
jgi:hypothetical protein